MEKAAADIGVETLADVLGAVGTSSLSHCGYLFLNNTVLSHTSFVPELITVQKRSIMSGEESTRLFVGGLSQQLPEEELNKQLSIFGTVTKLEIKEKKDLCTGEVIKRFAFATLDATRSRIDQCE